MENENVNNIDTTTANSTEGVEKTYTEAEVAELLQRNGDKRVTEALKKQAAKYEQKLSLSKLDEASRETAEKDIRIKELEEKLASYQVEKNRSELKSVLSARGLSAEFCDLILITDDLEESQGRIDQLDKLFKNAVAEEVKRRIATGTPQVGTSSGETTKEAFNKMSLKEKQELYRTNPELYKKFN